MCEPNASCEIAPAASAIAGYRPSIRWDEAPRQWQGSFVGALLAPMTDASDPNRLHGEAAIIEEFLAPLAAGFPGALGLVDDCAVLSPTPGHDVVLKTDPVAAGIHFLPDDDPADIAWRALAVNVSDLAAKAAVPRAYLMALSFPDAPTRAWMARFAAGLGEAQAAFGISLAGGDTDRRPGPVTISITVLGEVPAGSMVRRATARPGDLLYVSGTLGDAALGLRLHRDPALAGAWRLDPTEAEAAIRRYRRPEPRLGLRQALREAARAAMDLSDGLAKDLARMARASATGAVVRLEDVPLSSAGRKALAADDGLWPAIVAEGDDYEVLAAVSPDRRELFERLAGDKGLGALAPVHCIGEMVDRTAADTVRLLRPDGRPLMLARTGWDHF
jgi:thiamine-monophosphate kinase